MKIHLLLKKEEIDTFQMDNNKIAVVFDVLLATSTITACLDYGAERVVPVMDEAEALQEAKNFAPKDVSLVGEYDGKTIDGFLGPAPLALEKHVAGKTVVLSTTNGTVAIRKAASAKEVYIASLLNGKAVSEEITEIYDNETIIVICSGSQNQFCIEDFYGAGYFIQQLVSEYGDHVDLTDSALTAKMFYENVTHQDVLRDSRVGRMLVSHELQDDITFINQQGILSIIPRLVDGKTIEVKKTKINKET
ncbi:2-phosphosulfolactate phosphatase [Virgibacillus ainsalahensis]